MKPFGPAFGVANAVLYEGYLLFPYTASTAKNRVRWQFGVVVPQAYLAAQTGEHAEQQTEVLLESSGAPDIDVLLRFLQVEARSVEVKHGERFEPAASFALEGTTYLTFDEAVEREWLVNVRPDGSLQQTVPLRFAGGRDLEEVRDRDGIVRARIVRERWPLHGSLQIEVEPHAELVAPREELGPMSATGVDAGAGALAEHEVGPPSVTATGVACISKLRVRVENHSEVVVGERSAALRTSLVSTHVLLAIEGGRFLSVLDPPAYATAPTAALANRQTFPVLIGDSRADEQRAALVLSSPIILYDFPALGAQTDADAFDATEIDELLTLTVLSLSDDERAEARATDPRARAIIERAERFGAESIARIHAGSLARVHRDERDRDARGSLQPPGLAQAAALAQAPGFERLADPFADGGPTAGFPGDPLLALDVPSIDCVFTGGRKVSRGSSVRLHPKGRADIWDSVLAGKRATVRAIHQDLEDKLYVAVTVDDDPASDLHDWYGRSFFFSPDEVEPLVDEREPRSGEGAG